MARELFDFTAKKLNETDKAVRVDDGTKDVWLPKSQIEIEEQHDGTIVVTLPLWLAKEKGLV